MWCTHTQYNYYYVLLNNILCLAMYYIELIFNVTYL